MWEKMIHQKLCIIAVFLLVISITKAAPKGLKKEANKSIEIRNVGQSEKYHFKYKLKDGQEREETIEIFNRGKPDEEIVVKGSYSFWDDDDNTYLVTYTADKNGYHAKYMLIEALDNRISSIVLKSLVG